MVMQLYLLLMVVKIPTVGGAVLLLHLEQHLAAVGLLGSLGCCTAYTGFSGFTSDRELAGHWVLIAPVVIILSAAGGRATSVCLAPLTR